jgi:hypothetical protein
MDNINIIEYSGTLGDPKNNVADTSFLCSLTDFQPKFTIDEGLEDLISKLNL